MGAPGARTAGRTDDGRSASLSGLGGVRAHRAGAGRMGIAGVARCGAEPRHVTELGRCSTGPRASSCRTRADLGFADADGADGAWSIADVGIAAARTGRVAAASAGIHGAFVGRTGRAGARLESARGAARRRARSRAAEAWVSNGAVLEPARGPIMGCRSAGSARASSSGLTAGVA